MADTALIATAIASLVVAVGAFLVSAGAPYRVMRMATQSRTSPLTNRQGFSMRGRSMKRPHLTSVIRIRSAIP